MRYWLVMFRPETYELVKEHGLMGTLHAHRARFANVEPGDRFVAYISRVRTLDGYGEVTSQPFEDASPILGPGSERYRHRSNVRFIKTGLGRDARELLYGLSEFENGLSSSPANILLCRGSFMEITEEDFAWLQGCMEGTIKPEWEGRAP